jgi:hypothetical protein
MKPLAFALLSGLLPLALDAQDSPADTAGRFAKALQKLGSEDYQEREAGSAEIAALPLEALRLIEAELQKGDVELEVRSRLQRAIPEFKLKARRSALKKKAEAEAAWTRKTTIESYNEIGRKDPKWDAKAVESLTLTTRVWAKTAAAGQDRQAYELTSAAAAAGCDDPLILYARARMYDVAIRKSFAEAIGLHLAAATAMKEKGARYHELRQCFCFARAAELLARKKDLSDDDKRQIQDWLELALSRLGEAAGDPATPDSALQEVSEIMIGSWMKLARDRKVGFDKVFEQLRKARPESPMPLILEGAVYTSYAWDARGGGWANTVTEDGWKKMHERLDVAEKALTEAWKKNPDDPAAPTLMLGVELGQGKGRAVMETWYKRAMEADPDHFAACGKKMYYLEPKWHGSPEDMLGFGRELLAGGNWDARLPFKLVDAHLTLAGYADDKQKKADYYKDEAVWKDLRAVYEGYLKRHPESDWDRTFYAKLACWCGHWTEAKAQFDKLGEKAIVGAFADRAEMDRLKAEAAEKGN